MSAHLTFYQITDYKDILSLTGNDWQAKYRKKEALRMMSNNISDGTCCE